MPDALAFLACVMQWHGQAPFGASRFFIAQGGEPQILCIRQNTKNFQLFSGVTSEGTASLSGWLRQSKVLQCRPAGNKNRRADKLPGTLPLAFALILMQAQYLQDFILPEPGAGFVRRTARKNKRPNIPGCFTQPETAARQIHKRSQ